jgi:hypothetical protein
MSIAGIAGLFTVALAIAGPSTASAAPAPLPIPSVQVVPASDAPVQSRGEAFRTFTASVYVGSRSNPYLTGFADADGPISVDDELQITVTGGDSQTSPVWTHDFSNNCSSTRPQPIGPIFLGSVLPLYRGLTTITFTLRDKCGQHEGSSAIYLSGYGVIDPTVVNGNQCKGDLTKWLGGSIGSPIYTTSELAPSVGADHEVHGQAGLNVAAKVNCSATVEVALQTRVCNRFGTNCNPRDIATSGVQPMPDGGVYAPDLLGACRSGADEYRMQVRVTWATVNGLIEGILLPVPEIESHVDHSPDGDEGWVKLTC